MNAVVAEIKELPPPVARRGISEAQWRTLMNSLFPGAKAESVVMVWDYCAARKLDPMKKPCHIVPLQVKQGDDYVWRDVVMPGIYEYRTTAMRTGEYMGHSTPQYGPMLEFYGTQAPEWCSMTVYRWNAASSQKCEYPVIVYFTEACATKKDFKTKELQLNARWAKAPRQMLTKCTEAAGLREAFPDELGGEPTAEEAMDQSEPIDVTPGRMNPRGDVSGVNWEVRDQHVAAIKALFDELGSDEAAMSAALKDYVATNLAGFQELQITVWDKLVADDIATKSYLRKLCA